VCGGTEKSIDYVKDMAEKDGALPAKLLRTGGAFHTPLTQPAQGKLSAALAEIKPTRQSPEHAVWGNAEHQPLRPGCKVDDLVVLLFRPLANAVYGEQSVKGLLRRASANSTRSPKRSLAAAPATGGLWRRHQEVHRLLQGHVHEGGVLPAKVLEAGGGFHAPLTQPVRDQLSAAIHEIKPGMRSPRHAVRRGAVHGPMHPCCEGDDPVNFIKKQFTNAVHWEQPVKDFIEFAARRLEGRRARARVPDPRGGRHRGPHYDREGGALPTKVLKAGGAFHKPLVQPAQDQLSAETVEITPGGLSP
jgi:malonyl CoA-acyl carrier protein transacylase